MASPRKPEAFSEKENRAMRYVLRTLKDRGGWSQAETGRRLDIGQQAAGTILNKGGGFSRPTALKLAHLCGFESPEALLADLGALAKPDDAPLGWAGRDMAVGTARRLGYDEDAIQRVVARFVEAHHGTQPARWWMDRIVHESAQLAAERELVPPPSTETATSKAPRSMRAKRVTNE